MHEFSIVENIVTLLKQIAKDNNFVSIKKATLKVGKLRQIVPENMKFAFGVLTKDTVASSAELIIEEVPVKVFCKSCKNEFIVTDNVYVCPNCSSFELEILTGKEIVLENIEGEK